MTREMAENFIRWSMAGNSEDKFRPNEHLHLVLRLMYYSHVKPAYIYRLTPYEIRKKSNETGEGYYVTMRSGEYMYFFDIRKEEMDLLEAYIAKYNVGLREYIIQRDGRSIRKVFKKIAKVYKESGKPPAQLKEVYYAGISKE